MKARPFAKSVGGKTSLLPELLARVPKNIHTYYEPFVGGGALFFALANEKRFKEAHLNDFNPHLAMAWLMVRDSPNELIKKLKRYPNDHEFFLRMRKKNPEKMTNVEHAAWFLYLNKTAFNGLWRVNKKGRFNVPFAHYKNPTICDADNIRACFDVLQRAGITHSDFMFAVERAEKGDFVYFDSPYADRTGNFTSYTKEGFGDEDQKRLRDCARNLKKRGVKVLISNSDTELIRDLYKGRDFKIEEVAGKRSVGATAERRGFIGDVLIS